MPDAPLTEAQRQALELIAYRKQYERFRHFIPNGKCETFIRSVTSGKNFVTAFLAANGVGKTATGVNLLAHLVFTPQSEWFRGGMFEKWPFPKRARIVSDPTTVATTMVPELLKWFPANRFSPLSGGKHFLSKWAIPETGWEFDIMTYDQDPKEFESATLGYVWFDEPPPLAIFKATVARMRKGGIIVITATPLMGSAWMYDEIVCKQKPGFQVYFEAEIEDNCIQHGVRGQLEHEAIERMASQYSEDEKFSRMKGKFHHLTGLVFKKFTPEIHVIPTLTRTDHLVVVEALDPHPRNPDAVMWVGRDRKGRSFVLDEYFGKGRTEEIANIIKTIARKYRVVKRIADRTIFTPDQHTQMSLSDRLEKFGLEYDPASKDRDTGIRLIADALDYRKVEDDFVKAPLLYVCANCVRTIWEFQHWQWDDWRGRTIERKDPREKAVDKDDHMMENLGRVLMEEIDVDEAPLPAPVNEDEQSFFSTRSHFARDRAKVYL